MDTATAKQLTSAVRYTNKVDKDGRPRDPPLTEAKEAEEARKNYTRVQQIYRNARLRRQTRALQEIDGTGCRRSEDECDCGKNGRHVKLIVTKNGKDLSRPMCPWTIAIRQARLAIANRQEPNCELLGKLLKEATIDE